MCKVKETHTVKVGALGNVKLEKGTIAYVGSAWGPGGLGARICRHLSKEKKLKWHIDYILSSDKVEITHVIYLPNAPKHLEEKLATELAKKGNIPAKKLGATDTKAPTHLIHLQQPPEQALHKILETINKVTKTQPKILHLKH